jgi:hypothetical protein
MRILVSGAAIAALALGSTSGAVAAQCHMTGMNAMSHAMPHCTAKTGPVVWFMASAKMYYMKGSSHWGKGMGTYVCRATAVARGGHPGMGMMGGSSHGTTGGSHAMPGSSMPGSGMPSTMTMAPRPMSSSPSTMTSPMPGNTPGPGLPNSTNAAPGSMGSPMPSTSAGPTSGNQGNTGAPGAGGQVPNNPASSSNSNPSPRPSPRP